MYELINRHWFGVTCGNIRGPRILNKQQNNKRAAGVYSEPKPESCFQDTFLKNALYFPRLKQQQYERLDCIASNLMQLWYSYINVQINNKADISDTK